MCLVYRSACYASTKLGEEGVVASFLLPGREWYAPEWIDALYLSLSLLLLGKQAQTCLIGIACEVLKWAPIVVSVVRC